MHRTNSALAVRNALSTATALITSQGINAEGFSALCGVDEAGRGPLAGPVVAGAVIFRDCEALRMSRDSKMLSASERDRIYAVIADQMVFSTGICEPEIIDQINILQATMLAMRIAVESLGTPPDCVLVDGPHAPELVCPSQTIIGGDRKVALIGAASIIAKVTRDRIMVEQDKLYPDYGFHRHKGYPTAEHRAAIARFGPCPIHRKTFKGVREFLAEIPFQV